MIHTRPRRLTFDRADTADIKLLAKLQSCIKTYVALYIDTATSELYLLTKSSLTSTGKFDPEFCIDRPRIKAYLRNLI